MDQRQSTHLLDTVETLFPKMLAEIEDYAIILLDAKGKIINWNKGAEKIKGYSESEVLGKSFSIFYPEEEQSKTDPDQLLKEAAVNGRAAYEGWRMRKDKTRFWGSIVLTALHDSDGNVLGFSKVTRDLTERKAAEDLLKAKNAELEAINQELASFAYVASHDLQEPLRKIHTFLSRIAEMEKANLSEKSLDFFARIQSAAQRMQQLIQDLLAYSRTSSENKTFELIDLNEILSEIKEDMADEIQEKRGVVHAEPLPIIQGIKFQMNQLFTNLLNNSVKFSKPDETPVIKISSEIVPGKNLAGFAADQNIKYHHLRFEDNGIGFDPEFNTKVFDLFQRLHGRSEYSGTGIGLAICKKIAQNHRGFMRAEGKEGEGAVFHLYLPTAN
jgi:PAS domain S-box-containing protein